MPINPTTPSSTIAIDRLTLSITDVRDPGHPSMLYNNASCVVSYCFEAEGSSISLCLTSGPTCVCSEAATD